MSLAIIFFESFPPAATRKLFNKDKEALENLYISEKIYYIIKL